VKLRALGLIAFGVGVVLTALLAPTPSVRTVELVLVTGQKVPPQELLRPLRLHLCPGSEPATPGVYRVVRRGDCAVLRRSAR
jgi:hypothetical protein